MDTIVLHEYCGAGEDPDDILLWFQRHGARGVTEDYRNLSGANALRTYAMQRAASEIWRELDHERYAREKAEWEKETSAPYNVLRRMFWGRFRRYWNPPRQSGEIWLYHQVQKEDQFNSWKVQDCEDRRRGAEKRRIREQKEIECLGVDAFNQRMWRQKQESIRNRVAGVDRSSTEFLQFLDWRQSREGQQFDTVPNYGQPEKVFSERLPQHIVSTTPTSSDPPNVHAFVAMPTSSDLHDVLCRLATEKRPVYVRVTLLQTASLESVPVPYALDGERLARLEGVSRLEDYITHSLISHVEKDGAHYFGWGEEVVLYRRFPDKWRNYEGLASPSGNPQKGAYGKVVRTLKGCILKMIIATQEHVIYFRKGASARIAPTVDQVMNDYFMNPFEKERERALAARHARATFQRLRNLAPVGN